jgi:hypothetical protein
MGSDNAECLCRDNQSGGIDSPGATAAGVVVTRSSKQWVEQEQPVSRFGIDDSRGGGDSRLAVFLKMGLYACAGAVMLGVLLAFSCFFRGQRMAKEEGETQEEKQQQRDKQQRVLGKLGGKPPLQRQHSKGGRVEVALLALFSAPTHARFVSPTKRKPNCSTGKGGEAKGELIIQPLPPLQLMREIASLQRALPANQQQVCPAARWPNDVEKALSRVSPRLVQFSGHGDAILRGPLAGALAFEYDDGCLHTPDPSSFIRLLHGLPRLQAVLLNGCKTHILAKRIIESMPHLQVIAWSTVVHSRAAEVFAEGFYQELGRQLHAGEEPLSVVAAFKHGQQLFASRGYIEGDPEKGAAEGAAAATVSPSPAAAAGRSSPSPRRNKLPHGAMILASGTEACGVKQAAPASE